MSSSELLESLLKSNDAFYLKDFYYNLAQPLFNLSLINSKLNTPISALDELNNLHTNLKELETEEYFINIQFKNNEIIDTSLDDNISTQKKISNKINDIADRMSNKGEEVQNFLNSSNITNYLGGIDKTLSKGVKEIANEARIAAKALDPSTPINELKSMARDSKIDSNLSSAISNLSNGDNLKDITSSSTSSSEWINRYLHDMVVSLDGQTNVYIAFFTKDGKLYSLEDTLNKDNLDNTKYYYFFFTDNFEFTPVKKIITNLKYGGFSTKISLSQADGKNEFSFSIDSDLALTMWTFIKKENLGYNDEGYLSNDITGVGIDLNIILPEAIGPTALGMQDTYRKPELSFLKANQYKVNKFILTDIKFTDLSELNFLNSSTDVQNIKIKGICNEIRWYPDFKI